MRLRLLAFAFFALLGVTVPMVIAPTPASAVVRAEVIDGWNDEMGMPPGGFQSAKWQYYIKKMTQPMDPTKPRKFYPLTPSNSKFREFMINTLGSVLGAATPEKYQREQTANQNRYNHSWEKFEQDFNTKTAAGAPSTYDDYVLNKKDWKSKNADKVPKGTPVPATKMGPLRKGINNVGGGLLSLTAMPIGFAIVDGAMHMSGYDKEGQICASTDQTAINFAGILNGVDCDAWTMTQEARAAENADVNGGYSSSKSCNPGNPSDCLQIIGVMSNGAGFCLNGVVSGPTSGSVIWYGPELPLAGSGATPRNRTLADTWACGAASRWEAGNRYMSINVYPNGSTKSLQGVTFGWVGYTGTQYPKTDVKYQDKDAERTMSCAVTGSDGNTYSSFMGGSYKESEGAIAPPVCPSLPPGVVPYNTKLSDNLGNDYMDEPSTQPYKDWSTQHSDCLDGSCPLDLLVKTDDGSSIASCFDLGAGCHGWFESPDRDTKFECRYGGKKVDLKECFLYSGVFSKDRQTVGSPYSDTETGAWTGGKSTTNTLGKGAMAAPIQNPDAMRNCLQDGWAEVNPIEWVMVPVDCALQKAFVPRAAVVELGGLQASGALSEKAPGQLAAVAGGWEFKPTMTGCKKTVTYPATAFTPAKTMDVWNACPGGDMEQLAIWCRWIVSLGFAVLIIMLVKRSVGGTVDYRGN